jgi:hypothetical protein
MNSTRRSTPKPPVSPVDESCRSSPLTMDRVAIGGVDHCFSRHVEFDWRHQFDRLYGSKLHRLTLNAFIIGPTRRYVQGDLEPVVCLWGRKSHVTCCKVWREHSTQTMDLPLRHVSVFLRSPLSHAQLGPNSSPFLAGL